MRRTSLCARYIRDKEEPDISMSISSHRMGRLVVCPKFKPNTGSMLCQLARYALTRSSLSLDSFILKQRHHAFGDTPIEVLAHYGTRVSNDKINRLTVA